MLIHFAILKNNLSLFGMSALGELTVGILHTTVPLLLKFVLGIWI